VSPASGSGSGAITYSVARNPTTVTRSATIAINAATVTFTQEPNTVPGPPSALTAIVDKPVVRLAWQAPAGGDVQRYLIELAANPHFTGETVVHTPDAATSYQAQGLPPNQYWVRVSAVNDIGVGVASAAIAFTVPPDALAAPAAPVNLRWSLTGSRLSLTWQAGGGGPAAYFIVDAGLAPGRIDLSLPTGSAAPGSVYDGVPPGVYFVRVRAVNSAGVSAPSDEVAVYVGIPPPPAPPVNLRASVAGATVTLQWTPGSLAMTGPPTQFVVEAGSAPGAADHGYYVIAATGVVAAGVPPGTYYVRVRAGNGTGWSAPSNEIVVRVQ